MSYAQHLTPRKPAAKPQQFKYTVDPFTRLDRFLILGCEGGSYAAGSEREMTIQNAQCLLECAEQDADRTVNRIVEISEAGRAPKNDPAIFALAVLAGMERNRYAGQLALAALPKVCRTGTHLFQFVEAVTKLRGWGRGLRSAISGWYNSKTADSLAYQVTKYAQRNGWSHRDLLRLAHTKPRTAGHKDVFQYVTQREAWLKSKRAGTRLLVMAEEARTASDTRLRRLIKEEGLVREHIPTERLDSPAIWEALLENMPLTAMVRNLNKMTEVGVLAPLSNGACRVAEALRDRAMLKAARLHPFNILVALKTYASGQGFRGGKTWKPVPQVVSALEDAFYLAFDAVEPTNKRFLFGIDVSGSMSATINNTNVSCRTAAATLAMVGMKTEPQSYSLGFARGMQDLGLTTRDSLAEVERKLNRGDFSSTNCAAPMLHALQHRIPVDAFVVITDNDTNTGSTSPSRALEQYRQAMGIDAKMIVVGMTAHDFSIANPDDAGMLDMVGFDTAGPTIISEFVRG